MDPVNRIQIKIQKKINILIKKIKILIKKKKIRIIQRIMITKINKIQKLKVHFIFFLFNFIINFLCAVLTRSIIYFNYLKGIKKDVTKTSVTNKYQGVYFLPFILAKFSPHITPETEPIISYSFSMFILSLVVLVCFFNIFCYILSIYLITKYDVENKFPKFK